MARDVEELDGVKSLFLLTYFHKKSRVKLSKIVRVDRNNV